MQKMNRAERQLWARLGREPTLEEIADEANLPLQQAKEVKAAARASSSLDAPIGDTDDATLGDFVAGEGPLPDEQVEDSLRSRRSPTRCTPCRTGIAPSSSSATASTTPSRRRSRRSAAGSA